MHEIQLSDQLYSQAQSRAAKAGFKSVDDYVADVVAGDIAAEAENFDSLFTPERLAHIDRVVAKVKEGGKTYSMDEVRDQLAENREKWLKENGD